MSSIGRLATGDACVGFGAELIWGERRGGGEGALCWELLPLSMGTGGIVFVSKFCVFAGMELTLRFFRSNRISSSSATLRVSELMFYIGIKNSG